MIGLRATPLRTTASGLALATLAALATLGAFSAGFTEVSAEASSTPRTHDGPAAFGPTGTPVPLADPFVLASGARYFAFGSNSSTANIPTFTSTDLTDWSPGPDALPKLASWATDYGIFRLTWAPSVIRTTSGCDVPAFEIQCIKKSRSLNDGSKSRPTNGSTDSPATTMAVMAK